MCRVIVLVLFRAFAAVNMLDGELQGDSVAKVERR
jgi:hypothetical protein